MSHTLYAAAYDTLPIGVAVLDHELRIKTWNATIAKWSRVSAEEALGRKLTEVFPGYPERKFGLRLEAVFRDGQSAVLSSAMHEQVLPLQTADGRPLYHKTYASPAPEHPSNALLVLEDVTTTVLQLEKLRTERKRLQASERSLRQQGVELRTTNAALVEARQRAEAANQAKSEFLANMSHEVRTPLTAIKGFAEILLEHSESPFALDAAERVVRNGDHLLEIVNDVLDLSKIEAGKLALCPEPCSPTAVAQEVCDMLGSRAEEKGLELRTTTSSNTPKQIQADPMRLRQVLLNLVGNAIKFTPDGSIEVEVDGLPGGDAAGNVRFGVTDTGIGIEPSKVEAIFKPFAQEDNSTQRRYGGTGLGLAISRELVAQMGGRIGVSSEPGSGSTFTVVLPVGDPQGPATSESRDHHGGSESARNWGESLPLAGRRFLVAEDGPDNRRLIEYLLSHAGADVALVENGRLAVDAMLAGPDGAHFDAVVLDMQMPVMDGYTAATAMRRAGVEAPIVALTAHAMEGDRDKAIAAGCDDYLAKPINAPELIGLLAKYVAAGDAAELASV